MVIIRTRMILMFINLSYTKYCAQMLKLNIFNLVYENIYQKTKQIAKKCKDSKSYVLYLFLLKKTSKTGTK